MKTDVTYGIVTNALMIFVDAEPESKDEEEKKDDFILDVTTECKKKLAGTKDDDGNIYGLEMTDHKDQFIRQTIMRVVKTMAMEYDVKFAVYINRVDDIHERK